MKKVLIVHTGGTFGMTPTDPEKVLQPGKIEESLEMYVPAINQLADISINIPINLDSSNIGPVQWISLYGIIASEMENYDGFVIIHGTDTLVYTASALSYLFLNLKKPIIMTGSQRPLSKLRTDARSNLINSVELATYDIPEVLICFDNQLFRGNRTKKVSIESFGSFESPNYPALAKMGLKLQVFDQHIINREKFNEFKPIFNQRILSLRVFPGLNIKPYFSFINHDLDALILEGFGAGNLPLDNDWIELIDRMISNNKLVYIASQSPHGTVDLDLYACGKESVKAGALSLKDMTVEAALVKLMLLTGNYENIEDVKNYMNQSLAGEITI